MEKNRTEIVLTNDKLDVGKAFDAISSPYCGGSSIFLGESDLLRMSAAYMCPVSTSVGANNSNYKATLMANLY